MPRLILSGGVARFGAPAPTNSVRRRHVSKSTIGKHHDAPTAARRGRAHGPRFPRERSGRCKRRMETRRRDEGARHRPAARTRRSHRRGRGGRRRPTPGRRRRRPRERDALRGGRPARPRVGDRDRHLDRHLDRHANGTANDDADDEDGEDDLWFEHLPYILEVRRPSTRWPSSTRSTRTCNSRRRRRRPRRASRRRTRIDVRGVRPRSLRVPVQKAPGEVDEFIGYGALFASIANLGLSAGQLVHRTDDQLRGDGVRGKIGVLYLAALAPSSSLSPSPRR